MGVRDPASCCYITAFDLPQPSFLYVEAREFLWGGEDAREWVFPVPRPRLKFTSEMVP